MQTADNESSSNSSSNNTRDTAAEALAKETAKLRKDIQELEELNFQIECSLNICNFGDIKDLLRPTEPVLFSSTQRIPDVETEFADDLFRFAGMHCTKFVEDEYVFSFSSSKSIGNDDYGVQIMNASEEPKIGKWVMPMSVDMKTVLTETPLENTVDLKPFLANCKHHIDCYTNRVQQYDELQTTLNELSRCWVESGFGYTVITLKFFDMQDLESEELHNIKLYLMYRSNRVRPHQIRINTLNPSELSDATLNKFKSYFKHFKYYDLKKAFEETVCAEDTPVVWSRGNGQDGLDLSNGSVSSSEANFPTRRNKSVKGSTRRGFKRKTPETSLHSDESKSWEQSSDDSDSQRTDHPSPTRTYDEKGAKLAKKKGKRRVTKEKRIKTATGVHKISKKKSRTKLYKKNNVETGANASSSNLRQSTLDVQLQRPKEVDLAQLDDHVPLLERIMNRKSKSNETFLGKRGFGTSTPVSNLNRYIKRFAINDSVGVSPIKSANSTGSKKKQFINNPGQY